MRLWIVLLIIIGPACSARADSYSPYPAQNFPRQVYWGDTHLHTTMSSDANVMGNKQLTPDDAYRFARGETRTGHNGEPVRLRRPLDFLVVTDHAEFIGVMPALDRGDPLLLATEAGARWASAGADRTVSVLIDFTRALFENQDALDGDRFERSVWSEVIDNAERFNDPGQFTTFIGYEYTSTPGGDNLHRNVVFRDGADRVKQIRPFSAIDSANPEDLWDFLAEYETLTGGSVLAIPHNSNVSGGRMFTESDYAGNPLTREQAKRRLYFEPIVEVTQYKGDSETHPYLSPEDEFANYESWDAANIGVTKAHRDEWFRFEYARSALKLGIGLQSEIGANPYRFGLIGSTDSHTALAAADERDFWGKFSSTEPSAERWKLSLTREFGEGMETAATIEEWQMAASGYAAVWATENTREALFDAMRRKETYATTGPRMTVRFFGSFEFVAEDANAPDLAARGYTKGIPMGSDLGGAPDGGVPSFLIGALKDPDGANLDRVQVVKGWQTAEGTLEEKVYDVALSDGRRPSWLTGSIPRVGNTVEISTATYDNSIGDASFTTVWTDPDFDPAEAAFYYVRVIEIPKPRWTAYDAKFFELEMSDQVPMTTQDRAYTSPIWYTP